ncbi:MAG: 1-(5-phosphoribosyl)-5-[(5-phosphoribosylamino)methylideneamino] imidazole-4-carboxamide isomerase [Dethiosulfovibrio sp.]|nr:1-(5-phosphoribosyl)-5-[(5-phosphoribosylamino)methylideneamino] imidazole-4-carboxamide isomerase [Dethiosulfovibrio sp.]
MRTLELYPAIDLYGGKVVRLENGRFDRMKTYGEYPVETALELARSGCRWLHLIDLEGAEKGRPVHLATLKDIKAATGASIQYGGGLRTERQVEEALNGGANRVYLGSLIFKGDPKALWSRFGPKVVPSVDVKGGSVAISGWTETTSLSPDEAIGRLMDLGYRTFLVTSIGRDGTASGPELALYDGLAHRKADLIAAGGIRNLEDIKNLDNSGVSGSVLGTCLYERTLNLKEALEALKC